MTAAGAAPVSAPDPILAGSPAGPVPGAVPVAGGACSFTVWAPACERVEVRLLAEGRVVDLAAAEHGYHQATVENVAPGALYLLRLDGGRRELPDPASRAQPQGVHGPSQVVDPGFPWTVERWPNPPLGEHLLYELHVGTFTPAGTFAAVAERLDDLCELGVTALELMPVSPFAGARGWGYDGVYPWAVHHGYGGLGGLQALVDAAHRRGLAVFLDVVHNHLGPEGNYLGEYAPYFTDRYRTPWGAALNFDGPCSDEVRRFFIGSALHWIGAARIDGLRLDAIHAIHDRAPLPFVEELTARVHQAARDAGRRVHVVAESNANDPRLVRARERGGWGMDGQWNDDFHHALVSLLSGERAGYYQSYGERSHLERALRDGWVYTGQYSSFHHRRHGRPADGVGADRLIVFTQNHDQIGNRMNGERLDARVGSGAARLAAALVLLSPFVPLLFMGEEYGEPAPFLYFTSHTDPELAQAVREGRRREFAAFRWHGEPPDPQAPETFAASRLDWGLRGAPGHRETLCWYRALIALRRAHRALAAGGEAESSGSEPAGLWWMRRRRDGAELLLVANLSSEPLAGAVALGAGSWRRLLDSNEPRFGGAGPCSPADLGGAGAAAEEAAAASRPDPGRRQVELRLPPYGVVLYGRGSR